MRPEAVERLIRQRLDDGADLRHEFARTGVDRIRRAATAIEECLRGGKKVVVFGNGGSAADAQHLAAELVGRFSRERGPLPAIALTTDTSALTAIANDYGFEEVFSRQVRALVRNGDLVIAISTSGRSANVVQGVRAARARGASTIALTGGDGGELPAWVDISIVVPSTNAARIQELHVAVAHILCELIESSLFPRSIDSADVARGIVRLSNLLVLRDTWRREEKTVVWTNGCFDILHGGHVQCLEQAKDLGDVLIVGVNDDASVRALKGRDRPIFPLEERMRLLAALEATDYVVAFKGVTPEAVLSELKPDVHVKGGDYAPPSGKPMPERSVVESYGGRIEFVPLAPGPSTSDVVQRIWNQGSRA